MYSPQCLKITGKVSYNIASEASYVYILSGQKVHSNAKNNQFKSKKFLKNWSYRFTVLPELLLLIGQKLVVNAKVFFKKCDFLINFQTMYILAFLWVEY